MPQTDKYGRHELLDRTHLLMEAINDQIIDHKGLRNDEAPIAGRAAEALAELYQLLGERMGENEAESGD